MTVTRKKLIEVALPLEAINAASAREKSIRHGHPSTLHLWWARRPLAAARAVIFAQMVDDPSAVPEEFPTKPDQEAERARLHRLIEQLVLWENTTNETVLQAARDEIWRSWRRTCADNRDDPRAAELYNPEKLPAFHDPFAGGGSLPLEAQRLGLEAYASDLNPVAVLICKAMIEIPPKFAGKPPVRPSGELREARSESGGSGGGSGSSEFREARSEWGALSRSDRLAESNGGREGDLPAGAASAARGDVRDAFPGHPGGRIGPGEYRGGLDARIGSRESTVPGDSARLALRDGDPSDALRGSRLVSAPGDGQASEPPGRSQPDAHDDAPQPPPLASHSSLLSTDSWKGAAGLAEDVRYYGKWMRDEAEKRIGHLYPKVRITEEMVEERPDLKRYLGRELTVIAWLWARTVKSPNPAFAHVDVPLASTFMLSTKPGKEAYVEPVVEGDSYRFTVKVGKPRDPEAAKNGTKVSRGANFRCLMTGEPIASGHIYSEAQSGRMGARLMAIVAEGERGRVYLTPTKKAEAAAALAQPEWKPELEMPKNPRWFSPPLYGLTRYGDLFTGRQLVALTTFSDLVGEARERVRQDALAAGLPDDATPLDDGGTGAQAYADAVAVYLAFALSKAANIGSSIASWMSDRGAFRETFARQAIPMVWDFAEANPFADAGGSLGTAIEKVSMAIHAFPIGRIGNAFQADAATQTLCRSSVVSTDPPYYDNIGYADLSDYFYVWLRRSLVGLFPDLFATLAVPKAEELVATPYRHGGKENAASFFLEGMTQAMHRLAEQTHPALPVTIYYAFKQAETEGDTGTSSTGWETFLDAVVRAGFAVTGTWPVRTEGSGRIIAKDANALASSIILVCRQRRPDAVTATRTEFLQELSLAMREALLVLASGDIAPVDLAQASIGPGMAVYSKYAQVLRQDGKPVTVREALQDINNAISAYRTERTSSFDSKTRFCIDFYDQFGFGQAEFDNATVLARAQAVGVDTLEDEHLLVAERGKAWLVPLKSYPAGIAGLERRFGGSAWEACLRLAATLQEEGESATAGLARELGEGVCARARELAVWLYTIADVRKRPQDALAFNALDASWPEIQRLMAGMDRGGQQGRFA